MPVTQTHARTAVYPVSMLWSLKCPPPPILSRDEPVGASILDHPSPRAPAAPSSTQGYSSLDQWSQSRPPATSTSTGSLPAIPVGKPPPTKSSYTSVHACSTAFLPRLMTCRHNDTSYIIHLCAYRIIIMHVGVDICACVDIYGQRVWSSLISKACATLFAGSYTL